tara:strand:+ start:526 stop:972 length:447 start_codon:yes stop_codon:yes gene_type:complete
MVQSFQRDRPAETRTVTGQPVEQVPEWWLAMGGSQPEYWVYRAIVRTGRLMEAGDFSYQAKKFGGRMERGGAVVDFIIRSPYMGINVQSLYFHNRTSGQRAHDALLRASLEADGLRVEFISEEEAINRPDAAVREALAGTRGRGPLGI